MIENSYQSVHNLITYLLALVVLVVLIFDRNVWLQIQWEMFDTLI